MFVTWLKPRCTMQVLFVATTILVVLLATTTVATVATKMQDDDNSTLSAPQTGRQKSPPPPPTSAPPAHKGPAAAATGRSGPPVIGVLTQVLRDYKRFVDERSLHLVASYVKWLEMAGAQVLPILLNQNDSYYEQVFKQTNGLLFPGGDNFIDPHKDTPMMVAARKLYQFAVEANDRGDFYPIWGTCLGLELLSVLTSGKNILDDCSATDMTLPMEFKERGRLFAPADYASLNLGHDYAELIVQALSSKNITFNYHHKCLTDKGMRSVGLENFYQPLAYSRDSAGLPFVAIFEAKQYPFYGVQFHPEKPAFEFVVKRSQQNIPHSRESVAVSRYFADFFVQQSQKNGHAPPDKRQGQLLAEALVYASTPTYTALKRDMYEQRYIFPYQDNGLSTEEFLDYEPGDDEDAPDSGAPTPTTDPAATKAPGAGGGGSGSGRPEALHQASLSDILPLGVR